MRVSVIRLWLPPLALMGLIFVLSAQPDLNSGFGVLDHIGRKIVHASEYALLALLWWRALRTVMSATQALVLAAAIAIGYSITDELHQTTIHGRNGTPVDVLIDSCGALLAVLLVHRARTPARTP
jgi:VanZ family protein